MNQTDEKRLFADVELIKLQQGHTDVTLERMLQEFINHSTATNQNLTNLTLSSRELVIETRNVNTRIELIERDNAEQIATNINNFRELGKRVTSLETFRSNSITRQEEKSIRNKWWSDNWYKFVLVGVISVPVIALIYGLLTNAKP